MGHARLTGERIGSDEFNLSRDRIPAVDVDDRVLQRWSRSDSFSSMSSHARRELSRLRRITRLLRPD